MHCLFYKSPHFSGWVRSFKRQRARMIGQLGEWIGVLWFSMRGVQVIQRNIRVKRGEIDLLIHDGENFRIVEVRTITTHYLSGSLAAFNPQKQRQVRKTARALEQQLRQGHTDETGALHVDFMGIQLNPWWSPRITYLKHVEGVEGLDYAEYYSSTSSFTQ